MDFLEACHKRYIHVAAYPPHTTYHLQPLDASIFAPLAIYYSQELKGLRGAVRTEKQRKKLKKALFIELWGEDGNAAIFFLPAKIQEARDLLVQKVKEEEEVQAQKEQDKL